MIVLPAIDLRQGRCVRLEQGQFDRETVFSDDPLAVAHRWATLGATWLHVVNLDGALGEDSPNGEVIRRLVQAVPARVQMGGGLRSLRDVAQALEMGVARVVLGTLAAQDPRAVEEAVQKFGAERVAVAVDARERRVAVHGWTQLTSWRDVDFGRHLRNLGLRWCLYTDISRDGTGGGPNLAATEEMARETGLQVLASGGIASLEDVGALCRLSACGVAGMVIGRALYTGALQLPEVLRLVQREAQTKEGTTC
ncbi:MAG: 1-(5-phosphoribosyl)-5-[(5-phosphoribosylamino)methylideneamino]imidazole-4-carboxamide isomerase [Anaerolineae bacterium]|nr:1-(5-phosphoribosyl)-5-[(5-phosphoribosylamino)methylideneamino]imidazole-4-carboxamide isomerase [Anaerolineae bacterium]